MKEGDTMTNEELLARLEAAERVCLMVGWSAADTVTDRGKAKHELWAEWLAIYESQGGSPSPKAHPDLSDERIRDLAARRDATVQRTLALL